MELSPTLKLIPSDKPSGILCTEIANKKINDASNNDFSLNTSVE